MAAGVGVDQALVVHGHATETTGALDMVVDVGQRSLRDAAPAHIQGSAAGEAGSPGDLDGSPRHGDASGVVDGVAQLGYVALDTGHGHNVEVPLVSDAIQHDIVAGLDDAAANGLQRAAGDGAGAVIVAGIGIAEQHLRAVQRLDGAAVYIGRPTAPVAAAELQRPAVAGLQSAAGVVDGASDNRERLAAGVGVDQALVVEDDGGD